MKLKLISLIMIFSNLFSFGQKANYEIIYRKAEFFEFNSNRDKVYIYSYGKLSVYDVNSGKLSVIDKSVIAETVRNRFPFFLAKTGSLYFVSNEFVYEIKDGKIIKKTPFIDDDYSGGMIDAAYLEKEERKMKGFNKLIADYGHNDIKKLMDDVFILNYRDGHSVAFKHRRLKDTDLTKENKAKILKHVKQVDIDTDTSYMNKSEKKSATNYFDNNKLIIKERSYSCRKASMMSLTSSCKYKITVEFKDKKFQLKDTERRGRYSIVGKKRLRVDLYNYLPNSKRITDKKGNIYLIFWEKDVHNLIKIPVTQFK